MRDELRSLQRKQRFVANYRDASTFSFVAARILLRGGRLTCTEEEVLAAHLRRSGQRRPRRLGFRYAVLGRTYRRVRLLPSQNGLDVKLFEILG